MNSDVLFTGLRFDRKKFTPEVRRFKRKAEEVTIAEEDESNSAKTSVEVRRDINGEPEVRTREGKGDYVRPLKKGNGASSSNPASSAFNIFRPPVALVPAVVPVSGRNGGLEEDTSGRLAEVISVLRKRCRLHVSGQNVPRPLMSFEDLKTQDGYHCKEYIFRNIEASGYGEPTPIQRQAIPALLARRECLACAQTGSGKTLAFILPILMNLKRPSAAGIRAIVLCPVRELATQIAREFRKIAKGKKWRVRALTRSLCLDPKVKNLPIDVLVSTPLRLSKLLKSNKIILSKVEYLVLDESDKLFEMGFVKQIDTVVAACSSPSIVRALFSATLPDSVEELARTIMVDPVRITVGEKNSAASTVDQRLLYVGSEDGKFLALKQLFKEVLKDVLRRLSHNPDLLSYVGSEERISDLAVVSQGPAVLSLTVAFSRISRLLHNLSLRPPILLFVESKDRAKELHRNLAIGGVSVDSIHAGRSQFQRDAAVEKFREGKTWILIATDLMARGMDFKGVNCVINYDFPKSIATYIHRIGRTGRAGRRGQAITFHSEKDYTLLRSIANVIKLSGSDVPNWMINLPKNMKKNFTRKLTSRRKQERDENY